VEDDLSRGLAVLGATVPVAPLLAFANELLKWNRKVNLTAITAPREVADKHLLDSLAVLPELGSARSLLDLGAGAGLPGIPLAIALPQLEVTLAESVAKKVGFMKHAIATLKLAPRVRAAQARAAGSPDTEGLPRAEVIISRALMDVGPWLQLARAYLAAQGRVLAMLGQAPDEAVLDAMAQQAGLKLASLRRYTLPLSGDPRAVAVFQSPAC
jgi:16S rRNA (guanine527-N7)-methyltransferase